ncbi:MAG: PEP/pyruvate-binding domain-containing protein, partial [Syntrophobacteraceae bacterium]
MAKKWVYLFHELDRVTSYVGGDWEDVRALLGGKGASLADMTRLGLPVPPGFTVTTEACNSYLAGMKFPQEIWEQELAALSEVEEKTGKEFGDAKNPLLVSCRSGAKFSMPGMMDTVLNIGLNGETIKGMIEATGDPRFVYDSYRRLIQMFGSVVLGVPDEPFEEVIAEFRKTRGAKSDTELTADDWKSIVERFGDIFQRYSHICFPADPYEQLRLATEA